MGIVGHRLWRKQRERQSFGMGERRAVVKGVEERIKYIIPPLCYFLRQSH